MTTHAPLLDTLRQAVGAAHVLTEGDLSSYERDWRGREHGKALAVVRPANTAEVAAVVRACAAHGASIVPQGGNTGLSVGSVPDGSGKQVVLSQGPNVVVGNKLTINLETGKADLEAPKSGRVKVLIQPNSLNGKGTGN